MCAEIIRFRFPEMRVDGRINPHIKYNPPVSPFKHSSRFEDALQVVQQHENKHHFSAQLDRLAGCLELMTDIIARIETENDRQKSISAHNLNTARCLEALLAAAHGLPVPENIRLSPLQDNH